MKIQLERSEHLIDKCVRLIEDDVVDDEETLRELVKEGKLTGRRNAIVSAARAVKMPPISMPVPSVPLKAPWRLRSKKSKPQAVEVDGAK